MYSTLNCGKPKTTHSESICFLVLSDELIIFGRFSNPDKLLNRYCQNNTLKDAARVNNFPGGTIFVDSGDKSLQESRWQWFRTISKKNKSLAREALIQREAEIKLLFFK